MNNPVTRTAAGADHYALWPSPPGCTGHRLFCLLRATRPGTTEDEYVDGFCRMNLVAGEWSLPRARERAADLLPGLAGRRVVLLGAAVRSAFGHLRGDAGTVYRIGDADFYQMPHPSGRNPWYNVPANRALAGAVLASLYEGAV